jgi:hypothetical protein
VESETTVCHVTGVLVREHAKWEAGTKEFKPSHIRCYVTVGVYSWVGALCRSTDPADVYSRRVAQPQRFRWQVTLGLCSWLWSGRVYVSVSVCVCGFRVVYEGLGVLYLGFVMGVVVSLCACLIVCFDSRGLVGKFDCTFVSEWVLFFGFQAIFVSISVTEYNISS